MTPLKLPNLPDRTPVRLNIALAADLHLALKEYAQRYEAAYGVAETVTDLIPFMLDAFLQNDKAGGRQTRR